MIFFFNLLSFVFSVFFFPEFCECLILFEIGSFLNLH